MERDIKEIKSLISISKKLIDLCVDDKSHCQHHDESYYLEVLLSHVYSCFNSEFSREDYDEFLENPWKLYDVPEEKSDRVKDFAFFLMLSLNEHGLISKSQALFLTELAKDYGFSEEDSVVILNRIKSGQSGEEIYYHYQRSASKESNDSSDI